MYKKRFGFVHRSVLGVASIALLAWSAFDTGAAVATPFLASSSSDCHTAWKASQIYTRGNVASFNGINYRANWWTQGQSPASNSGVDSGQPWTAVGACTGTGGASGTGTGTGTAPVFLYSPYKDATISMDWNTNVISSNVTGQMSPVLSVLPAGVRALSLAFATGECGSENWAGVDGGALAAANIQRFTAANVNYVISTGGAAGIFTCSSDSGMAAFINRYASNNLIGIDFDIEAGQTQQVINDLVQRVVVAQRNYPNLRFSFTLATLAPSQAGATTAGSWGASAPDSFNIYGDWVMQAIQTYGLKNYTINLMTMDYGSAGAGNCVVAGGVCQMGQSAIQAAMNLHDHWGVPYSQIELTPMIGGNDVVGETFTPADAHTVAAYAKQNGLAGIHFWSFDRDVDCPPGAASSTCNSIGGVGTLGYSNQFSDDLASGR
ncbi:carbohydrate-binding protein [Burkholderia pyrrocinia]|uniref:carbohydrate-binding protein n=1 Tax=Burkholderia pyrrocinia TaxID=60550 RepID=UPI001FC8CC8D|nr:carbohydrate-binding protein [Burkholderia pyrrocinia]